MTTMTNTTFPELIAERLNSVSAAPFLFVGSGFSRRYLGLDDWTGLLRRLAALTGTAFEYYNSKANGSLPQVATLIAKDFHEIWWRSPQYASEREEFKSQCDTESFPLKLQIARYISESTILPASEELKQELDALRSARIDGIITTNWDRLLEMVFSDFAVYVGQNEAIFSRFHSIAEIYKIHGSVDNPNTLVLTEEDYTDFNSRNVYLAAKLITVLLEHPVIFLGYSLSDMNIRVILTSILNCLDASRAEVLSQRLLFVQYDEDAYGPQLMESSINLGSRDLRVTVIRTREFLPVFEALSNIERRLSARLLRQIKEHIYELVISNDPAERISVVDIEDLESHGDIEVVVGVGITSRLSEKGFETFSALEICQDTIDGRSFSKTEATQLVEKTLTNLLTGNRKYLPVYKYLQLAGMLDSQGYPIKRLIHRPNVLEKALLPREEFENRAYQYKREEIRRHTFQELLNIYGARKALPYLTFIDPDVDELERYLRENMNVLTSENNSDVDNFRKLICIYDRWRFGPGFPVRLSEEDLAE